MKVKVKKLHNDAVVPKYAKEGDAGLDLVATSVSYTEGDSSEFIEYGTSLAIEIPKGHVGLIYPRSSISNYPLILANSVGVIDSGYRGEIKFRFMIGFDCWAETENVQETLKKGLFEFYDTAEDEAWNRHLNVKVYKIGDKIGQLIVMPYPEVQLEEVEELSKTERGKDGFGSTGA